MKKAQIKAWQKLNKLLNENITEFSNVKSISYMPHDQENIKIVLTNNENKTSTTFASFYADPNCSDRIDYLTKNIPTSIESPQFKNIVNHLKDTLTEVDSEEFWK